MPERNREYGDDEFIDAVRSHQPASTEEVAQSVGCTRETARIRLSALYDASEVNRKEIRGSFVWFLG